MKALQEGYFAFQKQDFRTAVTFWRDALASSPDNHEKLHLNLGIAYSKLGDTTHAISHYRHAVTYSETTQNLCVLARACMGLGDAYQKVNEPQQAILFAERAIAIFDKLNDPLTREKARANCGLAYVAGGRTEDARRLLEESYQALLALGKHREAETVLAQLQQQKRQ